ncbi:tyrosine-type recombinase/integrase [Bradyrhizobium manausense]|uniref:tyrosine-type recombinase/integrase n=1 Tax=Bradyrhizobium manausense TaxID=989370 RepID=UPI001BA8B765|nr:tyrosine-type recombinase/integrase [Bradyrhizobium manausense]MBR0687699.1 tyrosine-type recombinase/integrase [Bradyrhizobium manausense]
MVRRIRHSTLEKRTPRLKERIQKKPYFVPIGGGLSIGYRRNKTAGTWIFRKADGKGGMATQVIGIADDFEEADGERVLTFEQATDKVRKLGAAGNGGPVKGAMTVRQAFDNYLPTLEAKNARSARTTKGRVEKHILSALGDCKVVDLTKTQIEHWQASRVRKSDDKEAVRKSKDSANRVLAMFKAFLNHAFDDKKNGIDSDEAWRRVKPFHNVGRPRDVRFSPEDTRRLIASIDDDRFQDLVEAGYATGARYEELTEATIRDFDSNGKTLKVSGKTGSRDIILQPSAVRHLKRVSADRARGDYIFLQADGSKWKASDQVRPMKAAVLKAELDPKGCFYSLRHAYISESIEENVPLYVIAKNCGTSIRMIEITYAKLLAEKQRKFVERGAPRLRQRKRSAIDGRRNAST